MMKKNGKKYVSAAGAVLVLALIAVVTIPVKAETKETDTIPQRVYFGDIPVGGMTQEEAKAAVQQHVEELQSEIITLQAGKNTVQVPVAQMGLSWEMKRLRQKLWGLEKAET